MSLNENEYRGTHGNLRLGRAYKTKQGQRSLNQESTGFSCGECQSKRKIKEYVPIITEDDGDDFDMLGDTQEEDPVEDDAWYK